MTKATAQQRAIAKRKKTLAENAQRLNELPIWPEKIEGGSLVAMLNRHVQAMRKESAHGNQQLFLDDVFLAYLLAFFNPTLRALRTIEDFSATQQAQKHLTVRRICKSTLCDFNQIADASRLNPIIATLRGAIARKQAGQRVSEKLPEILQQVIAVDGTYLPLFAEVVIELPGESPVRLLTTLLDLPAELLGLLYRQRWQIELFFRWLKCYANFSHLISNSRQGIQLNFYVAVIGVLLMYLHTSGRPSKYLLSLLGLVANGASLDDILPILRERERQCARDRLSEQKRRARKKWIVVKPTGWSLVWPRCRLRGDRHPMRGARACVDRAPHFHYRSL